MAAFTYGSQFCVCLVFFFPLTGWYCSFTFRGIVRVGQTLEPLEGAHLIITRATVEGMANHLGMATEDH